MSEARTDDGDQPITSAPLTDAQKAEINRRLAAHRANPQAAIPWEKVQAEAISRLATNRGPSP